MDGPRAVVCGSRHGRPTPEDKAFLCKTLMDNKIVEVIHGGARGYDTWAGELAKKAGLPVRVFDAMWAKGDWAGPERNRRMVKYAAKASGSIVVAFPSDPCGPGTRSTIWYGEKHGLRIFRKTANT